MAGILFPHGNDSRAGVIVVIGSVKVFCSTNPPYRVIILSTGWLNMLAYDGYKQEVAKTLSLFEVFECIPFNDRCYDDIKDPRKRC